MAKINNSAKEKAYAVALSIASRTTFDPNSVTASKRLAKKRSAQRSTNDLNKMFSKASLLLLNNYIKLTKTLNNSLISKIIFRISYM